MAESNADRIGKLRKSLHTSGGIEETWRIIAKALDDAEQRAIKRCIEELEKRGPGLTRLGILNTLRRLLAEAENTDDDK